MIYMDALILDIILSCCIAMMAKNRGGSFALWFIISIVLDPIVGLILMLLVSALRNLFSTRPVAIQPEKPFVDVNSRPVPERQSDTVSAEDLYHQSEQLFRQATKLREAADSLDQRENKANAKRLAFRPRA